MAGDRPGLGVEVHENAFDEAAFPSSGRRTCEDPIARSATGETSGSTTAPGCRTPVASLQAYDESETQAEMMNTLPTTFSASSPPIRVGVVGAGSWAALAHIPAILAHPDAKLVGIADSDSRRLLETADHYGIEGRYADHRELLAAGVDALVVATPHATHHRIGRDALDAGAHVLVEKPLTLFAAEARDLDRRAAAGGLHLVGGYTYNFTEGAAAARRLVREGALGDITLVSCLYASCVEDFLRGRPGEPDWFVLGGPSSDTYAVPALSGGGQGQAQVTHAAEMLLSVMGVRARRVCAMMADLGATVDVVDALSFELENGALGTIASTGALRPGQVEQQELRYYGTKGTLLQDMASDRVEFHPSDAPARVVVPGNPGSAESDGIYPLGAPVTCLIELILGRGENLAPAAPAIATVEFLQAAYRSAREGSRPVRIAELTD
jgi:predicted dehydrogenase